MGEPRGCRGDDNVTNDGEYPYFTIIELGNEDPVTGTWQRLGETLKVTSPSNVDIHAATVVVVQGRATVSVRDETGECLEAANLDLVQAIATGLFLILASRARRIPAILIG